MGVLDYISELFSVAPSTGKKRKPMQVSTTFLFYLCICISGCAFMIFMLLISLADCRNQSENGLWWLWKKS